jgi:predicted thioesterase
MKPSLQPGIARVNRITVDPDRTISFMGDAGRVYATPWLIGDIEYTCRDLILEHADAGEDSVGVEIVVKHLAPTLPAMMVEIMVRVNAVVGRKVTLDVVARDELDEIARGTHTRFVVDTPKTIERLKAKAARLAEQMQVRK